MDSLQRIDEIISLLQKQRILVLGDLMLDEFIWGKVDRISPEAPVPVVQVTGESWYPGGAANVARNLADFGIRTSLGGLLGNDAAGEKLLELFGRSNISNEAVFQADDFHTIVKTRIIARHQQVVRVDREKRRLIRPEEVETVLERIRPLFPTIDAVIVEDYGKGFITQPLLDGLVALAEEHMRIVTVDPNPNNPLDWSGVTLVKPNRKEAFQWLGLPESEEHEELIKVGRLLLEKWRVSLLLITMGEEGMMLFDPPNEPYHTPTRARDVYDVSGAGDTVIAFVTAALAAGLSAVEAAEIANHAAGIVVGKLGTATVTPEELRAELASNSTLFHSKK
ncbi:MAG: D-glycero-beta-D-manno-heptose-7-phosphate kinase [candidate division KSB1 bacterium]|nr:D-glycero-beta-D-manno-heptose-7-phosphate kinase [candidate division KSB1 bacterium]